ncbi:WhiB family transcriptional regulator [Streptomyces sp. NPDC004009]
MPADSREGVFVVTCTSSGDQAGSDWRDRAACVGEDPEIFFPLSDLMTPGAEASLARAICRRCPVIIDCRTWALDHGEDDGIWGATTAAQRRSIRRAIAEPIPATRRSRDERGESGELAVVLARLTPWRGQSRSWTALTAPRCVKVGRPAGR